MNQEKSGKRTLAMSVLMSAPGPLVVGLGLIMGKSSTQLADFARRSSELAAIIVSYIVFSLSCKPKYSEAGKKARLEKFANICVGAAMCFGGAAILFLAIFAGSVEKGNVIPGLCIALLGVIANSLFWRKYAKLSREGGSSILSAQVGLYRAKSLVDGCVTLALTMVLLFPGSTLAYWFDLTGSVIVSMYLMWSGFKTVKDAI